MRRRWILLGALLALSIGLTSWRLLRDQRPARKHATTKSRLDVAAFRIQLALRVKRARELASRRPTAPEPDPSTRPRSKAWQSFGQGATKYLRQLVFSDQCLIGPEDVCNALGPLMEDCETDARSCIAIGDYLADTPPRILIANFFFFAACRLGDSDGCSRLDDLEPGTPGTCEDDPWACGWRAYKTRDYPLHEEACSLGAAESCAMLAQEATDPDIQRAYYETSCQLGNTLICAWLATLLAADCEDDDVTTCLPIDEEGAARAAEMACAAGFTEQCR